MKPEHVVIKGNQVGISSFLQSLAPIAARQGYRALAEKVKPHIRLIAARGLYAAKVYQTRQAMQNGDPPLAEAFCRAVPRHSIMDAWNLARRRGFLL